MTLQNQTVQTFYYTDEFTPNSSVVEKVYYDEPNELLAVGIKHGPYIYFYGYKDVPVDEFSGFRNARSAGRYYNSFIKGDYFRFGPEPDAPWGFQTYPVQSYGPDLTDLSLTDDQLARPFPKDAATTETEHVTETERVWELLLGVPSTVRVKAVTLDEALSLFRTDHNDYLSVEVLGGRVVEES